MLEESYRWKAENKWLNNFRRELEEILGPLNTPEKKKEWIPIAMQYMHKGYTVAQAISRVKQSLLTN